MKSIVTIIIFLFVVSHSQAQQDSIAQLHQPYQTAMGMLQKLQNTLPKDSAAIAQEWTRLNTNYKRLSDSLQQHSTTLNAINFEVQRLINAINYRRNEAKIQEKLNALYSYVNQHQEELLEDNAQFNKIAQGVMGVKPAGETKETKIIQHNAEVIKDFYEQLNTKNWSDETQQRFIDFFATAYLKIGSVSKAEKFTVILIHCLCLRFRESEKI